MKNKTFTIGLTLLVASSLLLTNCTKGKKNDAPAPDDDTKSTQEVNRVQIILSDIHEIGATIGGQNSVQGWQSFTPLSIMQGTNTISSNAAVVGATTTPGAQCYEITFNNTVGKDGHVRNGYLKFYSGATTTVAACDYYDQAGWTAVVTSIGYTVDDYTVAINSMTITNTTIVGFPTAPNTPTNTNLTWRQDADVTITRGTQTNSFNGYINKTLLNTNIGVMVSVPTATNGIGFAQTTFTAYKPSPRYLDCPKQWASYSGQGAGLVQDVGNYNVTFSGLTRNFNASPEKYTAIAGMFVTPERHPFLSGSMSFKAGDKPARAVNFGSSDHFDYNAKVTISGITYDVDCKD